MQFLRFIILLNQLIPISLYVTLELVKVMQCTLLSWDLHMYHKPTGTPFLCRTTTLNEELGQVQYVLTDKTGQHTLTADRCPCQLLPGACMYPCKGTYCTFAERWSLSDTKLRPTVRLAYGLLPEAARIAIALLRSAYANILSACALLAALDVGVIKSRCIPIASEDA